MCTFVCKFAPFAFEVFVQPAPKKPEKSKKADQIEVEFNSPPREILHFNRYLVENSGSFLQLSIWFLDSFGASTPVFRGLIWKSDFKEHVEKLKRYIEKIGSGSEEEQHSVRPPMWNSPPVSFNLIDCVSRNDCSEIIIRNFSHKFVMEASIAKSRLEGTTQGVYISDGSMHRQIVVDLIKEFSAKR